MYHETSRRAATPVDDDVDTDGGEEHQTKGPHDHPTCPVRTGSGRNSPTPLDARSDCDGRFHGHHANPLSNAELLASGFTPPSPQSRPCRPDPAEVPRDHGDQSPRLTLAEENAYLQQKINGLQVLPRILEKKAAECRHWKQEAEKANAELAELKARQSSASAADAETIAALKLQAVLFKEDYDKEKQKYDKLKRDYDTTLEERNTFLHQMRKYEDETFQLRYEVSELRNKLQKLIINGEQPVMSQPLSSSSQQTSPGLRRHQQQQQQPQAATAAAVSLTSTSSSTPDLPASSYKVWTCKTCTYDNAAGRNFCEMCGSLKPKSSNGISRLQVDEPTDY